MQTPNRLDDYEWPEEWRRKVIVYSICAGMTNNDIVDKLKLPLRTIQRIRKQLVDSDFDVEAVAARKTQDRAEQRPSCEYLRKSYEGMALQDGNRGCSTAAANKNSALTCQKRDDTSVAGDGPAQGSRTSLDLPATAAHCSLLTSLWNRAPFDADRTSPLSDYPSSSVIRGFIRFVSSLLAAPSNGIHYRGKHSHDAVSFCSRSLFGDSRSCATSERDRVSVRVRFRVLYSKRICRLGLVLVGACDRGVEVNLIVFSDGFGLLTRPRQEFENVVDRFDSDVTRQGRCQVITQVVVFSRNPE
ncbi:unnamed protein product [Darwinula stevensoni]|uniref:Uncharacterized protein n=1 Tax=Darwinula stevensoni TaxID=69355 RepID=A0A7R9FQJ6_9CRUS|nr:unnamed protein product [Darwinula stevensoni]CAG0899558.1 unnamed protein product [Darwinula stevensoni]